MQNFQQRYATSYPSTFSREPSYRPSYIPQTTFVNGNTYPVYYDWSHGGYGYWSGSTWTVYDVMRDTVMLNMLMNQNNYGYSYAGNPPMNYNPPYSPGYYPVHHNSFGGIFSGFFFVMILIVGANILRRTAGF